MVYNPNTDCTNPRINTSNYNQLLGDTYLAGGRSSLSNERSAACSPLAVLLLDEVQVRQMWDSLRLTE